ncbi:hypothetical protein SALBM135S_06416 [Streptomyces alboniger]
MGGGIYLALMTLLAVGLTAVLRSGVAVLSILIPFTLIVSFVVGDMDSGVAAFLPDKAGQQVLHEAPTGTLGPGPDLPYWRPGRRRHCSRAGGRCAACDA